MNPVNEKHIFLNLPELGGEEEKYILEALHSGYIAPGGPSVQEFEQLIAKRTERSYALATSTGTAALHLILKSLGVSSGDLILCSNLTFIGGVAPINYLGAEPCFIDSNLSSWNMDPELLEKALSNLEEQSKKPKAIILTHIYGLPSQEEEIYSIANKYDIPIIEDCAEALGTTYKGNHVGKRSYASFYSFNGNKMITTSGGGMITTDKQGVKEKCEYYATQAKAPTDFYQHEEIGYNYRLSNILAALGIAQFKSLDKKLAKKKAIAKFYKENLNMNGISYLPENSFGECNYWLNCFLIDSDKLDVTNQEIISKLVQKGIEARYLWKPMSLQPVFKEGKAMLNGTAEKLFSRGFCLPSGCGLTESQLTQICDTIKETITQ